MLIREKFGHQKCCGEQTFDSYSAMALGDLTSASCSGGASAAPLSALAARLAERATGNIAAPPPQQAEPLDINSLRNGLPRRPQRQPPPPPPHRQVAPPPPRFLPVPQPDSNATTARFERAFARALPSPQGQQRHPARIEPPRHHPHIHVHHPNANMGWGPQAPYMYGAPMPPPMPHQHQMPPYMMPRYVPQPPRTVQPQPPVQPQQQPPVQEPQQQQPAPAPVQDPDSLYSQVVRMLGQERTDEINNAAALGLLARAQESWGDGFTGLDGFGDDDRENASGLDSYENDLLSLGVTDPANEPYTFDDRNNNQYNGLGAAEALAEGIRLRDQGQLARALLSFEAALNRPAIDPSPPLSTADQMRAWYLLGVTLAECDDDARAIQALSRVVGLNESGGTAGPSSRDAENHPLMLAAQAALALSVSYVNELDVARATAELWRWLSLRAQMRGDPPVEQPTHVAAEEGGAETGIVEALEEAARRNDGADIQLARWPKERTTHGYGTGWERP